MIQKPTSGRLLTALRLAFYPAFEPAAEKRFEALTMEAENARGPGDLAKAEKLYLTAMAEAGASADPLHLNQIRHGLARVYQEQRRYREAEHIFRDQLEEAVNSPQPNTQVHAGHMSLARLYQDEGKPAEAEEHYKAAVVETEKTELWPDRGFFCSTSMWLAKFLLNSVDTASVNQFSNECWRFTKRMAVSGPPCLTILRSSRKCTRLRKNTLRQKNCIGAR